MGAGPPVGPTQPVTSAFDASDFADVNAFRGAPTHPAEKRSSWLDDHDKDGPAGRGGKHKTAPVEPMITPDFFAKPSRHKH
jgi:hypothetical protein